MRETDMKVMLVNGSYPPETCGVGDYTKKLAEALSLKKNVSISVLTSSYLGIKPQKKPARVIPAVDSWRMSGAVKIAGMIKKEGPDIVHFEYPNTQYKKNLSGNLLPVLLRGGKTKIVETWHEPVVKLGILGRIRVMFTMFFADALIFVEKKNYDTLPWYVKAAGAGKKTAFIDIGSNIPAMDITPAMRKAIKKSSGVKANQRLMVTFGFITETKGFDALLEVFDPETFKWVHLGEVNEGEHFQEKWKEKAESLGFYKLIKFIPGLPEGEVAKWLNAADVCVFPFTKGVSKRHGSFLAAASQRCYIVTTRFEKLGFDKKENIWYVAPGDTTGLKRAMMFRAKNKKRDMVPPWGGIAEKHMDFYRNILTVKK
jgi:glycosyltransferase involved in cell wall biosynthesis